MNGLYEAMARIGQAARPDLVAACGNDIHFWSAQRWHIHAEKMDSDQRIHYRRLLILTSNPAAFTGLTDEEAKTLRELRDLWADHAALRKVGTQGEHVLNRLDQALAGSN